MNEKEYEPMRNAYRKKALAMGIALALVIILNEVIGRLL